MQTKTQVRTTIHSTLERAFKTPMLCDVTKVHTGWWLMPKVTHCMDDATWGRAGGSRRIFMAKNGVFPGGEAALDKVLERVEDKYWKIEVSDFRFFALGFTKFQGEWRTTDNNDGTIDVVYSYTLFSNNHFAYPLHWLVTKLVWRTYMKHVVSNIRALIDAEEPYLHA